jgi:hypothetical protein
MTATLAQPRRDINHVLAYGQSLASGFEGWPALSLRQPFDSLMLGDSVRPRSESSVRWEPVGAAQFRPLTATVQDFGTGALLSRDQVARLPRGALVPGETVLEGAVNCWRARLLRSGGAALGRGRLLASACGVGGRTLEALSKGAQPELFNRLRDCVRLARDTAAASGQSYGIGALLFLQGEHNSRGLDGGTADRAGYVELLRRFRQDCLADLAGRLASQQEPPAMLLYQTGGAYATDSLSVAQAQLEFALGTPGCFLAAPSYPVSEKSGHLDANGYRWLGTQFGKVLHRVVTLGQTWRPLYPLGATLSGQTVQVEFHVPVPPLAWGRPCVGQRLVDVRDRGFSVVDSLGAVPVAAVELAGATSVRILLARPPTGTATLRYADKQHGGRGSLHDSDTDAADDCYEYDATSGHYPQADIPGLVGRPYPLQNWCVAFAIPLTAIVQAADAATAWELLDEHWL